jgi:hypothetical protein
LNNRQHYLCKTISAAARQAKRNLLHKREARAGWRGAMPYMGKDDS